MYRRLTAGLLVLLVTSPAAAGDLFDDRPARPLTLESADPLTALERPRLPQPADAGAEPAKKSPPAFGEKGSQVATVGGGIAYNFNSATDWDLRFAWSTFVVRDVEFSVELNGWYFDQPGDNAFGINPAFVFRWHFYNEGNWSIYGDAGIGLLFTTEEVPDKGTDVNFTPRVGCGFTHKLDDEGTRLQAGVRWHHISNARITGDSGNPARDGVMLYAGVMFPF